MALQAAKLHNSLKIPLFVSWNSCNDMFQCNLFWIRINCCCFQVRLLSAPASGSVNKHNPNGWKSWQDIPDSMIPTTSKIDPDNDIYKERHYINLRKKQIWYQVIECTINFL